MFDGAFMIKNENVIALFAYMALFFGCFHFKASSPAISLKDIERAVEQHDPESVSHLLYQHGSLAKKERRILSALALEEIESLKIELEDEEQEQVNLYNAFGGAALIPLSIYLIYKQIPRLTGRPVQCDSRYTYALTGIGALALIVGIATGLLELIKANSDNLLGLKLTKEETMNELQKTVQILELLQKAQ